MFGSKGVTRRTQARQLARYATHAQEGGHRSRRNEAREHPAHLVPEREHRTSDCQLQDRLQHGNQVEPLLGEKGVERPKHHFQQRSCHSKSRNQSDIEPPRRPEPEELHDRLGKEIQGNQHE